MSPTIDWPTSRVAVCIVGLLRTLVHPAVYTSIATNVMGPLLQGDVRPSLFTLVGTPVSLDDQGRRYASIILQSVLNHTVLELLSPRVPSMNRRCTVQARYNSLSKASYRSLWVGQWERVAYAYQRILRYEAENSLHFRWIIKLRPDLVFLKPIDLNSFVPNSTVGVNVGYGIVGRGCMNDHVAMCSRPVCSSYFEPYVDYARCNGSWSTSAGYDLGKDRGSQLLRNRMLKHGVQLKAVPVYYTLFRSCALTEAGVPGKRASTPVRGADGSESYTGTALEGTPGAVCSRYCTTFGGEECVFCKSASQAWCAMMPTLNLLLTTVKGPG